MNTSVTWRQVAPLLAAIGIVGSQSLMASPLLPDIARSLGTTVPNIGLALSAYAAATALAAALAVPVLDKWSRAYLLTGALAGLALGLFICGLASSWWGFALGQFVVGASAGIILPTTYAFTGDLAPEHARSQLLGRVLLGWSVSLIIGVPLGSLLGDLIGWRGAFMAMALAALLLSATIRLALPVIPPAQRSVSVSAYGEALALPGVRGLLVACICYMFAFYGMFALLGDAYRTAHGASATEASLLAVVYGVGFAATSLVAHRIDQITSWRMLIVSYVALALIYTQLGTALPSALGILAWCGLLGLFNHAGLNALVASLTALSSERRGSVMALYSASTYVGFSAGTAAMGAIYGAYGLGHVGYAAAAALAIGSLAAYLASRAHVTRPALVT
jgi:predicted MFS family arabinose efflux permease